nr:hypothetical protein [Tanacetum cinerariifolium]
MLGAASAMVANVVTSSGDGDRLNDFANLCNEQETAAADVLAGICVDEKTSVKAAAVDNDVRNPSVSSCHLSDNHTEEPTFNFENHTEPSNLSSALNELLQSDATNALTSGFVRSTAMDKRIMSFSGCYMNTEENSGPTKNTEENSGPTQKADDCVEVLGEHNKVEDLDKESPGTATSKFVESVLLCNRSMNSVTVEPRDSSVNLDIIPEKDHDGDNMLGVATGSGYTTSVVTVRFVESRELNDCLSASNKATVKSTSDELITSSGDGDRINDFANLCNEQETAAADVLAGICGSISPEALGSCITSSVDHGDVRHQVRTCKKLGGYLLQNVGEDDSCSDDDSCGKDMESCNWTDEEKSKLNKGTKIVQQEFFDGYPMCKNKNKQSIEGTTGANHGGGSDYDHEGAKVEESGHLLANGISCNGNAIEDLNSTFYYPRGRYLDLTLDRGNGMDLNASLENMSMQEPVNALVVSNLFSQDPSVIPKRTVSQDDVSSRLSFRKSSQKCSSTDGYHLHLPKHSLLDWAESVVPIFRSIYKLQSEMNNEGTTGANHGGGSDYDHEGAADSEADIVEISPQNTCSDSASGAKVEESGHLLANGISCNGNAIED